MLSQIDVNKVVAVWEIYKSVKDVPGAIVECGVFKGNSLLRFAYYRRICGDNREIIGFDTFGKFPEASYEPDKEPRARFIRNQGDGYSAEQIRTLVREEGGGWVYLIEGDVCQTVPQYARPDLKIALLNIDIDLYEPTKVILETFYPLVSDDGVVILDDYNIFPGETRAANEYCQANGLEIKQLLPFNFYYIKK